MSARTSTHVESNRREISDVFVQEGMQKHVQGFEFNIDTGEVKSICCKQLQCGLHESRVIMALVKNFKKKGTMASKTTKERGDLQWHWCQSLSLYFVFAFCIACLTQSPDHLLSQSLDTTKQWKEQAMRNAASQPIWMPDVCR
jgi:hypothetical protein